MIPFSSQVSKFKGIYNKKIQKFKKCDTIVFGEVLGHEKAFLIQNMCPVTEKYIKNEYIDSKANIPVRVDGVLEKKLKEKSARVLALERKGIKLIFPDVLNIEEKLIEQNNNRTVVMICPLSSRQVKYLKVSDKNTYISFWSVGIFMHTISLYIF